MGKKAYSCFARSSAKLTSKMLDCMAGTGWTRGSCNCLWTPPANPFKSRTWGGKAFRSGQSFFCLPWTVSIPHPPSPAARLQKEHTEPRLQKGKGILKAFFFLPLHVKKLNTCFEFLIQLSSFYHLFCFVMHYIQLHISNPQILP